MKTITEQCANCGRMIGKLETPNIYNDHVVCSSCWDFFNNKSPTDEIDFSTSEQKTEISKYHCPGCGSASRPVRREKGSVGVGVILFLIMILPGVLYFIFYHGYVLACPKCGLKVGDTYKQESSGAGQVIMWILFILFLIVLCAIFNSHYIQ